MSIKPKPLDAIDRSAVVGHPCEEVAIVKTQSPSGPAGMTLWMSPRW